MRVAIDGMGGDLAPNAAVKGCIEALKTLDVDIYITGPENQIREELSHYNYDNSKITIIDAAEVISPNEHPALAIKKKKDSSLVKALFLLKEGTVDAVISAGSTGAFIAGATLYVGRIKGVKRPALAPIMPGKNGSFMVIDAGGNVDCKPEYLLQFAIMGKVYYENVMKINNPSIGLVNIGVEEEKGNELTKATYQLLKDEPFNFVGNIEPREVSNGDVNVLVCDGFVGNTILKMYEGVADNILSILKKEIMASTVSKIGGVLLKPVFKKFKKDFDYTEYGGSPFLGTKGICIKAHGSSDAKAFKNAILQCEKVYSNKVIEKITEGMEKAI
ncbi:MAG: phosphate acyltransferase PlsX [Clostridiaceae bacterium]